VKEETTSKIPDKIAMSKFRVIEWRGDIPLKTTRENQLGVGED